MAGLVPAISIPSLHAGRNARRWSAQGHDGEWAEARDDDLAVEVPILEQLP